MKNHASDKTRTTIHGLIVKKPLGRATRILMTAAFSATLFIPLLPLTVQGTDILRDSPEFCISCHVMDQAYRDWSHSVHGYRVTCGDCHIPQESVVTKLAGKARNGLYHGYAQVLGEVPDPIRITRLGARTVMTNCVRCHGGLVSGVHMEGRRCWDCHRGIGHKK